MAPDDWDTEIAHRGRATGCRDDRIRIGRAASGPPIVLRFPVPLEIFARKNRDAFTALPCLTQRLGALLFERISQESYPKDKPTREAAESDNENVTWRTTAADNGIRDHQ